MISRVEDYRYVVGADIDEDHPHGDLDRIIIDGGIMPKRAKKEKKDVRGEDIAFLREGASCRWNLGLQSSAQSTSTFTREVVASQVEGIRSTLINAVKEVVYGTPRHIDPSESITDVANPILPNISLLNEIPSVLYLNFPNAFITDKSKEAKSCTKKFKKGDVVLMKPIERLFDLEKKMTKRVMTNCYQFRPRLKISGGPDDGKTISWPGWSWSKMRRFNHDGSTITDDYTATENPVRMSTSISFKCLEAESVDFYCLMKCTRTYYGHRSSGDIPQTTIEKYLLKKLRTISVTHTTVNPDMASIYFSDGEIAAFSSAAMTLGMDVQEPPDRSAGCSWTDSITTDGYVFGVANLRDFTTW